MTRAHVTYFAGAAEAAGTRTETVDVPQSIDAAELRACLAVGKSAHFADLVGVCALIIDGQTIRSKCCHHLPADNSDSAPRAQLLAHARRQDSGSSRLRATCAAVG